MVQLLSKKAVLAIIAICMIDVSLAQQTTGETTRSKDYKDPKQHEQFYKRRNLIGAWQINKLKDGALVVRLKTNQMAIDELNKAGNTKVAQEKELESFAINKNTMFAFKDNFNFCKVYFILSNQSDSLIRGARSGIFLDTNLQVDPSIVMNEKFYLIAERDYGYNSSIGFVPEDSAAAMHETGNPVKQMAFVIKNKYGHQLKSPFPYFVAETNFMNAEYDFPITVLPGSGGGKGINFYVNRTYLQNFENKDKSTKAQVARVTGNSTVKLQEQFTYEKLAQAVETLDDELNLFHRSSPAQEESSFPEDVRPFLY